MKIIDRVLHPMKLAALIAAPQEGNRKTLDRSH
jgi:hypothetical protein